MTFPLPTDTSHVRIESRQYRLLNYDLGEGIRRSSMKVAAMIFVPWLLLMWLLGVSFVTLPWLWIGPPAVATWLAVNRDDSGRVRVRTWLDAVAFRMSKHRQLIVNGETAVPDGGEDVSAQFAVIDLSPTRRKR